MSKADEILGVLTDIREELRLLNSRFAVPKAVRSTPSADAEVLKILLPAISLVLGDTSFTANELVEYHSADAELSAALKQALGNKREKARVIGNLFSRCQEHWVLGYHVSSCGDGREGTLWRVVSDGATPRLRDSRES